jgi:hypothetical protein
MVYCHHAAGLDQRGNQTLTHEFCLLFSFGIKSGWGREHMPTIASFYGVAIRMYIKDHPPPHFHAIHGDHEALVAIETGETIEGELPKKVAHLVKEWTLVRREQLRENWRRARAGERLEKIAGSNAD